MDKWEKASKVTICIVDGQVTMVNVPDGFPYPIEVRDYDAPTHYDKEENQDGDLGWNDEEIEFDDWGDAYVSYMVRY